MSGFFVRTFLLVLINLLTCPSNEGASRDQQQPIGAVLCQDGLASCPVHSSTCCLGKSNKYFCCPLPNAVCCADGIHCCPQCFSCNVKGSSCVRPAADAAAVRIFSLVSHIDKRIQTPPPTPPAAAAVAAAAKRKEIEENKASAYAAAVARKKAAEESEGFVSGVLSAVKLTLFSKAEDGKTKKPPPVKVSPSLISPGSKLNSAPLGARSNLNNPQLKNLNPVPPVRPPVSGISKSSGILVHATTSPVGKQPPKVAPKIQTPPVPVQKSTTVGGGVKKSQSVPQKEEADKPSSGFFSSMFSAVSDFYSGGIKEEPKSSDATHKAKYEQQKHQIQPKKQQQQQQQKNLKQQHPTSQQHNIPQQRPISKQVPQQNMAANLKFQAKSAVPAVNQQLKKPLGAAGHKVAVNQAAVKLQNAQALKKTAPTKQQQNVKQNVGITQKSAAAAIATQERKAKAWEAKQSRKL